jgi:serine/threonine protein kinase
VAAHGRYNLLRKIADGGTAEVFLAHMEGSAGFKRLVVLKRVRPALWADEAFRRGLVDEAHIAMGLHHSNIVQVIDLGVAAQRYFLAFELVDGWTLSQVIKRAKAAGVQIPLNVGLHIMAEVCRGLSYAHNKAENGVPLAIVHRDVSPQNVLLSEQGEVKLTDFGIARARTRSNTSEIGSVKGKPAFMSPEQAAGSALDARSDLFPIGTMIYLMATGELPFTAPTALEEMARVVAGKFANPTTLRPDLPKELVQLINKVLERKVEKRFQSAEELLHAIEKVQRTVLEPAGTTELKAWLADLSKKDGELPLSRQSAPAAPSAPKETTEPIELQDEDIVVITQPSELLPGAVVNPAPRGKRWIIAAAALVALLAGSLWAPLRERLQVARVELPPPIALPYDAGTVILTVVVPPSPEPFVQLVVEAPDAAVDAAPSSLDAGREERGEPAPVPEPVAEPVAAEPAPAPVAELPPPPMVPAPAPVVVKRAPAQPEIPATEDRVSVLVESEPTGAQVRIDNRVFGSTPIPLRLKVGIAFELVVSKGGYREQKVLHFVTKRTNQKVRVALVKGP